MVLPRKIKAASLNTNLAYIMEIYHQISIIQEQTWFQPSQRRNTLAWCEQESVSVKWMQPTQSRCHQHQPAGGGPGSSPPEPLALQTLAYFDISQPLATQTSGSYYSAERATKRHFHNETSHFASVLPPSPRACPNMCPPTTPPTPQPEAVLIFVNVSQGPQTLV